MPRPRRAGRTPTPAEIVEGEAPISTGTARLERDRDDPDGWLVHVNGVPSSYVDLADPTHLAFEYQQWTAAVLDAVLAPPPRPVGAVHLGGAGCAYPRYLAATRPGSRQLVLEVDEQLVDLVRRSFGVRNAAGFKLKVADAREGLTKVADGTQDVVVRDAFSTDTVPAHLLTREFLTDVDRVLAPGGLWIANLADRPPMPNSRAEVATAASVFASVALLAEPSLFRGRRYGNALLVASQQELPEAALVRAVSGGVAPARVLVGADARHFSAGAAVVTDAGPAAATAPRVPVRAADGPRGTRPTTPEDPDG